jgi:hypothetical protein
MNAYETWSFFASEVSDEEGPDHLALAQHHLQKLGMYARYSPESAAYLRECIAHELEGAIRTLLRREGPSGLARHRETIDAARGILAGEDC